MREQSNAQPPQRRPIDPEVTGGLRRRENWHPGDPTRHHVVDRSIPLDSCRAAHPWILRQIVLILKVY